jgi:hypothetical protein
MSRSILSIAVSPLGILPPIERKAIADKPVTQIDAKPSASDPLTTVVFMRGTLVSEEIDQKKDSSGENPT